MYWKSYSRAIDITFTHRTVYIYIFRRQIYLNQGLESLKKKRNERSREGKAKRIVR